MDDAGEDAGIPALGGKAIVSRYIDHDRDVVVARGEFRELFRAYDAHAQRWEEVPDGLSEVMVRQGLGGLSLYLCNRPVDEVSAWTIHIHKPLMNIFFAGDAGQHAVVGRVFLHNVKEGPESQLFVETQRRGRPPHRSTVAIDGLDILLIFEQYFSQSEQHDTRFFEVTNTEFAMVQSLPGVDSPWLRDVSREDALVYLTSPIKKLDDQVFQFHCGCDVDRMTTVVRSVYAGNEDELFQGDDGVEVVCPRCGHKWWLTRTDFEADA